MTPTPGAHSPHSASMSLTGSVRATALVEDLWPGRGGDPRPFSPRRRFLGRKRVGASTPSGDRLRLD